MSKKISSFCLFSSIIVGIILTLLLLIFANPILNILGAKTSTYSYTYDFYKIISLGPIFIIFSLVPQNLIQTEGLAFETMLSTMIGTIVAIILDPIFLFGLANIIGYLVTEIILIIFTLKRAHYIVLNPKLMRILGKNIKDILRFDSLVLVSYAIVAGGLLIIFSRPVTALFMNPVSIVSPDSYMLIATTITMPFVEMILVYTTIFQSIGNAWDAFVMAITRQGVIYFIILEILKSTIGYHGIVWSQAVSDILTWIIGYIMFKKSLDLKHKK